MTDITSIPALRVRPRVWIGVAVWVGYITLILGMNLIPAIGAVPYTDLADSGANLFWGIGVSLIVGTIVISIVTSLLGWWGPALRERQRSAARWPIFVPLLLVVVIILNLLLTDWSTYDAGLLAAMVVVLLVGFTEEMVCRGLLLVGLRSRFSEGWVWFLSTAAFALMHAANSLTGESLLGALNQVGTTFILGTSLYIVRRVTGSLIWAMLLHGFWDISAFGVLHGTTSSLAAFPPLLGIGVGIVGVAIVFAVIRGANERTAPAVQKD